ncbi:efflux RND transporter periplasmic adaptor subunit [Paracoccus denitrificans]|jgi:RND family efflux transporter MFP subunit|uniref:Efflux transporter, RND family, MFP subunit n=1 Tax=Paracoccus denitrificans (strain Pd 1222) TaxID=318586 RepID=A1BB64_PARDP|nr:efflux RND transporter periplasmic adaptor subunit [Paracoccus denitrificans]ABL72758.1 efflux transporter, RND family, MFP subunit [Paracoccus denitrificans PD1222]MBB4626236.1 RND family efflux transporter MFP subunit [Paracoccus denitrificans]MCU7427557.1 efflux RND transporter periplasmic adaptor subunit [Paracoccus denitrificans]QAR29720.1 efflux RND transporter periplasmic adaptor subunit [Paracoccus denitrificans]UFS68383.1 efflux RND transporter periplasmic adaptor subunit [Paracocc
MRLLLLVALVAAGPALAEPLSLDWSTVPEMKAVYGTVEARDTIPARARIGGTVVELLVGEGDRVEEGATLATVRDDKIAFQIAAYASRIEALRAQLAEAESDFARGQSLVQRGAASQQRLEQLRTAVDVIRGQIAATEAERAIIEQQQAEGAVLAPVSGRVLSVPAVRGSVVMPGEVVASVGGGGFFLRLSVPERHAADLAEGAEIQIRAGGRAATGRLAKVYPLIQGGRVQADVEVDRLPDAFVGARVAVDLPVGQRRALLVPAAAITTRAGVDFVSVAGASGGARRAVVTGGILAQDGIDMVEILTGLAPGEGVIVP